MPDTTSIDRMSIDRTSIDRTSIDLPSDDFAALATLEPLSDDELARLALAADPDTPVAADAVSLWDLAGVTMGTLLPAWYMPAAGAVHTGRRWRRVAAVVAITAFVGINATGLCSTYGWVSFG